MSKSKAIKKPKNEKLWANVKLFFLSLFSNDACVSAREKPWYSAVIIALVSLVLAVTPIGVARWSQSGSEILNSPTYDLETALIAFQEDLSDQNVKVDIENGSLSVSGNWNDVFNENSAHAYEHTYQREITYIPSSTSVSSSSSSVSIGEGTITKIEKVTDLVVFNYSSYSNSDINNTEIKNLLSNPDIRGNSTYSLNTMILGKSEIVLIKKPSGTASTAGVKYFSLDMNGRVELESFANFGRNSTETRTYAYKDLDSKGTKLAAYQKESIELWKAIFNEGWNGSRVISGWQNTGITFGIFAAVIFFMGLMVFIMTRGKSNPFRIYTFWQTQKIAYWAALSPAILALILGFIWSSFGMLFFIFLFGIRVMWMSMRSLRPMQ